MASPFKELMALDPTREQVEAWCRQRVQAVPSGPEGLLCRVLGKYLMYVHQRDYSLTPHLAMNGIWEPWITMAIARHVQPGMRCMDVGACYGYYSLLMADIVSESGYVEAWEPFWFAAVRNNAGINGLRITVRDCLMGTDHGARYLGKVPKQILFNAGDVRLDRLTDPLRLVGAESPTNGIATGAPDVAPYDFIKIDVEGSEMDVWAALCFVRQLSPNLTVCMEFTPKQHKDPRAALDSIVADGFTMGSVGHDGVPRPCSIDEALVPDTGDFRMLWLTRRHL